MCFWVRRVPKCRSIQIKTLGSKQSESFQNRSRSITICGTDSRLTVIHLRRCQMMVCPNRRLFVTQITSSCSAAPGYLAGESYCTTHIVHLFTMPPLPVCTQRRGVMGIAFLRYFSCQCRRHWCTFKSCVSAWDTFCFARNCRRVQCHW